METHRLYLAAKEAVQAITAKKAERTLGFTTLDDFEPWELRLMEAVKEYERTPPK